MSENPKKCKIIKFNKKDISLKKSIILVHETVVCKPPNVPNTHVLQGTELFIVNTSVFVSYYNILTYCICAIRRFTVPIFLFVCFCSEQRDKRRNTRPVKRKQKLGMSLEDNTPKWWTHKQIRHMKTKACKHCWSLGACRSPWQYVVPCWAPADITPVEVKAN